MQNKVSLACGIDQLQNRQASDGGGSCRCRVCKTAWEGPPLKPLPTRLQLPRCAALARKRVDAVAAAMVAPAQDMCRYTSFPCMKCVSLKLAALFALILCLTRCAALLGACHVCSKANDGAFFMQAVGGSTALASANADAVSAGGSAIADASATSTSLPLCAEIEI